MLAGIRAEVADWFAEIGQGILTGLGGVCAIGLGASLIAGMLTPKAYRYAAVFGAMMVILACM